MVMHRGTRVAGLLPPSHPGSDSPERMRTLDLPRDLRTRAGRQAPAHGALEVPRGTGRRGGAGRLAGDDGSRPAVNRHLDAASVRVLHSRGAGRAEPDLTRGA